MHLRLSHMPKVSSSAAPWPRQARSSGFSQGTWTVEQSVTEMFKWPLKEKGRKQSILTGEGVNLNISDTLGSSSPDREPPQDLRRALGQAGAEGEKLRQQGGPDPAPAQHQSTWLCWGLGQGSWVLGARKGLGLWSEVSAFQYGPPRHTADSKNINWDVPKAFLSAPPSP